MCCYEGDCDHDRQYICAPNAHVRALGGECLYCGRTEAQIRAIQPDFIGWYG